MLFLLTNWVNSLCNFVVEITYKTRKLEKQLTSPVELTKTYGSMAQKIRQRLAELDAADCLAFLKKMPSLNCHELKGAYKGRLAIVINGNYRIVFEPYHDPVPTKLDGGLDWEEVTQIRIIEIVDYH